MRTRRFRGGCGRVGLRGGRRRWRGLCVLDLLGGGSGGRRCVVALSDAFAFLSSITVSPSIYE